MSEADWEEALFVDRAAPDPDAPVTPFVALQRVVIRMLFDPAFVERVYASPTTALAGIELDAGLVAQLVGSNDRRLWNADRLRRSRALEILMDEFKVTTTLVLAERGELEFLDAFFGSELFHAAVQRRAYMALAFVAYLEHAFASGQLRSPHTRATLELESSMARSRRDLRDARRGHDPALRRIPGAKPGERWVVRPGVRSLFLASGTLELVQHIEKYLFRLSKVRAMALCRDAPRPEPLPVLDPGSRGPYLLEPEPRGKVQLSGIPASFAHLIAICDRPVGAADLARRASDAGVAADDVPDLVRQLDDAGILRRVLVSESGNVVPTPTSAA
jgi:hypothetical protein